MKLIFWPNSILKTPSEDVKEPVAQALLDEMRQIMRSHGGVGLSAIQVAIPQKIIVIGHMDFINAEIVSYEGQKKPMLEGCLSLPGFFEPVDRYEGVTVKYVDKDLKPQQGSFTGIVAHALQHEIEHTKGMLFVDKLPAGVRSNIMGNMMKLRKAGKLR